LADSADDEPALGRLDDNVDQKTIHPLWRRDLK
jgi:hypothetical protein